MKEELPYHEELAVMIAQDFRLEDTGVTGAKNEEALMGRLREIISHLLDRDMERLLHILYRIDVPEPAVRRILSISMPGSIADELSRAIIERMKQKLYYRRKYRS